MRYLLILIILLMAFPVYATDEWTRKDTAYQGAFLTLMAADYLQTKEIARNPRYHESNPILGRNPSQNDVDIYFLATTLLHTSIAYYLPKEYRRIWQCFWIGIETGCVRHNINAGIRIHF